MPIKLKALKVVIGIIVFSLVIPFSPPVSFAKAKMCCKTKCSKMMGAMTESKQKPIKHCDHKKSPVNCCQENCSNLITFETSEPISFIGKRIEVAPPQISNLCVNIISTSSLQSTTLSLQQYQEPYRHKIKSPPIFITISSFLI